MAVNIGSFEGGGRRYKKSWCWGGQVLEKSPWWGGGGGGGAKFWLGGPPTMSYPRTLKAPKKKNPHPNYAVENQKNKTEKPYEQQTYTYLYISLNKHIIWS